MDNIWDSVSAPPAPHLHPHECCCLATYVLKGLRMMADCFRRATTIVSLWRRDDLQNAGGMGRRVILKAIALLWAKKRPGGMWRH